MIRTLLVCFSLLISFSLKAQDIPDPGIFMGYEIGTAFSRHADVVNYFKAVAASSDWVTYQEYGKTYERRPLTYAVVSTPQNLANLEEIRAEHLRNTGILKGEEKTTPTKAIVWLSYNVHGNEASGTEAAMQTLHRLLTDQKELLQDLVIIIDPCVNPDGRDRYANWYNQVKTEPYTVDPTGAGHHEPWPGGRPNHYLFDLNRDWAWATQLETRARLKIYNRWMPHIHVDFHEQGINDPYYFAPAAEPFHEVITDFQQDFQKTIGKNNAKYFDANGWLFFTGERFDLLYPSYGDTYPLYMGAIGMTYEQGGSGRAGLAVAIDGGHILTLKDRIAHHVATGLTTVTTAAENIDQLNAEFRKFFSSKNYTYKSYVMQGDPDKLSALTALLDRHEIQYGYSASGSVRGYDYMENKNTKLNFKNALVVSTDQPKGTMVNVLFEPETRLSTPLTYDITAWSLPYAYGLQTIASTTSILTTEEELKNAPAATVAPNAAGYISKWKSMDDARFLAELIKNDIHVRFSSKEFTNDGQDYDRGSLIITRSDNASLQDFDQRVVRIANKHERALTATTTSFATTGPDFGSGEVHLINQPKIGLVKGSGTSSLGFGAAWFYFEQDLKYPVITLDTEYLNRIDLHDFDILILPDGSYNALFDTAFLNTLKTWIQNGGKLIAIDGSIQALVGKPGFDIKENKSKNKKDSLPDLTPYAEREQERTKDLITGSIFKTNLDTTHPLAFGYEPTYFSLKLGNASYALSDEFYNVGYMQQPQSVSGFAGAQALENLKNSLVFAEQRMGRGSVIYMVDDPLFRAFWENGKLLFTNALFFVKTNSY